MLRRVRVEDTVPAATPGQQGQTAGLHALIFRFSSWRIYEEGAGFLLSQPLLLTPSQSHLPANIPAGASWLAVFPSQAMQQAGIVTQPEKHLVEKDCQVLRQS